MPDFFQNGVITTLHDLGTLTRHQLELQLERATAAQPVGLVLPVTAADMRAEPFLRIVEQLEQAKFINEIVVVLGLAPSQKDYREAVERIAPLGDKAHVLWIDGPRIGKLHQELRETGLDVSVPGKGQSVWTAFGFLLSDPKLKAFVLHDCDIVNYDREIVARLCFPLVHPGLDFEFCKAYYARFTDHMHGRVMRLLVTPIIRALRSMLGYDEFLLYLDSFRYPLSGEFAVSSSLVRSNRIPSDWGLEIGTLAEVFRNTSLKRICQVDLCRQYEHKHQSLALDAPDTGLMRMAADILTTLFRTVSSRGTVFNPADFITLRSAYLRVAQDAIRQYHADALFNGLSFDRHEEEQAVEGFTRQIIAAGEVFQREPSEGSAIPNWTRVLSALPDFPQRLRQAVMDDASACGSVASVHRMQMA